MKVTARTASDGRRPHVLDRTAAERTYNCLGTVPGSMGDEKSDDSRTADAKRRDPYDESDVKIYECSDCGHRMEADHQPEKCPKCGGDMLDISVSRE